ANVTPRILEILKQFNAKATFFMLGNQVDYYPDIAYRTMKEGHEVANHSKSHPDFSRLSIEKMKNELDYTTEKIKEATGHPPKFIRPPYGAYTDEVVAYAGVLKQPVVLWSVDSLDWKSRNPNAIKQEVVSHVSPGAIVLMHDIHSETADAL